MNVLKNPLVHIYHLIIKLLILLLCLSLFDYHLLVFSWLFALRLLIYFKLNVLLNLWLLLHFLNHIMNMLLHSHPCCHTGIHWALRYARTLGWIASSLFVRQTLRRIHFTRKLLHHRPIIECLQLPVAKWFRLLGETLREGLVAALGGLSGEFYGCHDVFHLIWFRILVLWLLDVLKIMYRLFLVLAPLFFEFIVYNLLRRASAGRLD